MIRVMEETWLRLTTHRALANMLAANDDPKSSKHRKKGLPLNYENEFSHTVNAACKWMSEINFLRESR